MRSHREQFVPEFEGSEIEIEQPEEEKLKNLIEQISESLREKGVPVDSNCRLDMDSFQEIYSQEKIEDDKRTVREREKKWYRDLPQEGIKKGGEKLEILKTIIFHKFIGENFIVVRTSTYDDIINKADNLILEKKTGNPVCAYDEAVDVGGQVLEKKKMRILDRNKEGGTRLKYGIALKENKLIKGEVEGIPLYYLCFPIEHLEKAKREILPSLNEVSDYEKKVFEYFVALMQAQTKTLNLKWLSRSLTQKFINLKAHSQSLKSL